MSKRAGIVSALNDLEPRIRSQYGKAELSRCINMVHFEFGKFHKLESDYEESKAEAAREKAEFKKKLAEVVNNGLSKMDECIYLVAQNEKAIGVNKHLAISCSPLLKCIFDNDMSENRNATVELKMYNEQSIRILVAFMLAGESYEDIVKIPKLSSIDAYQLLELLSYMEIPWAFLSVVKRVGTESVDLAFMINVSNQITTCQKEFLPGWTRLSKIASEYVYVNIDRYLGSPDLSGISLSDFCDLVFKLKDETLPESFSDAESPENSWFYKDVHQVLGSSKVSAFVHVGRAHPFAFTFNSRKAGQFQLILQVENKRGDVLYNTKLFESKRGFKVWL